MIIVKLQGGLGNQLFQYSLGRCLAEKQDTSLKLDTQWFNHAVNRQYDLGVYNIRAEIASPKEVGTIIGVPSRIKNIFTHANQIVAEKSLAFDSEILQTKSPSYVVGYFQSEKYFQDIAPIIHKELTIKQAPYGKNYELLSQISKTEAISLHIRRGDYVSNPISSHYHGTCSLEYYETAMSTLTKKLTRPHFYIFSDDIPWSQAHLKTSYDITFVDHNGDAAQEDIRLMSACKHNIVANSTFSWWGAWLNQNPEKTVIAPRIWFHGGASNPDLVPESWVRI